MTMDLYPFFKTRRATFQRLGAFMRRHGIEFAISLGGLLISLATVLVGYTIGSRQETLQAGKITDSYFNGIGSLLALMPEENRRINLLVIARTEAIINDLNQLNKPLKLASVITFIANLKPELFYEDTREETARTKFIRLSYINLKGASLRDISLLHARLQNSNLTKTNLTYANFSYAKMTGADFRQANLKHTLFNQANLTNANFYGATLNDTHFEGAILDGAIWINGKRCQTGSLGRCLEE